MVKMTITGVFGADGEYEFDPSFFTNRELHRIKTVAGVRAGELSEAIAAGDSDLVVALAMIALARNGRQVPEDALWDAEAGKISLKPIEEEAPAGGAVPPESEPAASVNGSESSGLSGPTSSVTGVPLVSVPSPTGSPV
jgi:hypothetical protein